jgi:hypothetical protein
MAYFDPSLSDEPFAQTGARLRWDLDAAEPRLRALNDARASAPRAGGKWSRKQILGHLIDSAANNHHRFVRGQNETVVRIPNYAQEHWVASQRYGERPWHDLIALWCAYNRHLAHVIAGMPESCRNVSVQVGTDPPATLSWVALDYVGHIQHHLAQIFEEAAP